VSSYGRAADPHRWSTADTISGFLSALALVAGSIGLVWKPVRVLPFAILAALIAALMSERNERIAYFAMIASVVCWTVGMTIAVLTENPLY
jgi:predicted permease